PDVRVFDGTTGALVREFMAFDPSFTGGIYVAAGDTAGVGRANIIVGAGAGGGPNVKVFDGVSLGLQANFFAYAPGFSGGVRVAAGDVTGDGKADIVTGAGAGGGPHVKVIDATKLSQVGADGQIQNTALKYSFLAFSSSDTGGVYVAAGDLDGDGKADIVASQGTAGSAHVRTFSGLTGAQT